MVIAQSGTSFATGPVAGLDPWRDLRRGGGYAVAGPTPWRNLLRTFMPLLDSLQEKVFVGQTSPAVPLAVLKIVCGVEFPFRSENPEQCGT